MKNLSTGFGLALLAGAILAYPFVNSLAPSANASAVSAATTAVSAAIPAQTPPEPTVVWVGTDTVTQGFNSQLWTLSIVWRAWSDGKIEAMTTRRAATGYNSNPFDLWCSGTSFCTTGWMVVSTPSQGLTFRSDINFDAKVDGADLSQLLADWGDAPRQDIPPSDCPLALINPR